MAPRHLLIAAGDHSYEMDYVRMIGEHVASGANATIAMDTAAKAKARAFGVVGAAPNGQVFNFIEKPGIPESLPGSPDLSLVSMRIYVVYRIWLREALMRRADLHDFGQHVLQLAVADGGTFTYRPLPDRPGSPFFWREIGTLDVCAKQRLLLARRIHRLRTHYLQ